MHKDIGFTDEELKLIGGLIGGTRKKAGSRKHQLCKDIIEKIHDGKGWADLHLTDVETGKRFALDFTWFCFPGMKSEGYRIEGFRQTGKFKGCPEGEMLEFGSLILAAGQAKIVNW